MEPRDRAAQDLTVPVERDESLVRRFRITAASAVLVAIAFIQVPGRILGDTKADLVIDPAAFLTRALDLWDPNGYFGQVQNQAYGYLFPMGPFFWLGDLVGLEPWVIQRLWWALILVVGFLGVVKLCDVLGIGTTFTQILGGFAYALSPRILSTLGPASIEVWPMALAPWVLVPLVLGLRQGSPRYYAALSAIAVACVGGVNAAATFAVIPLGALWLLMAEPGSRRRSMILWWPLLVLLGTLWWLIPLFLMAFVSPPFLDFIESAATTTVAANPFDALRGTTHWVPYVDDRSEAGRWLIIDPILVANSVIVIAFGLIGLCLMRGPVQRFLVSGLVLGLVLITMGHGIGVFDDGLRTALDGLLAPLRNAHKFDPVLRIPLTIGLVYAVSTAWQAVKRDGVPRTTTSSRVSDSGVALLAAVAVLGACAPALAGAVPHDRSYAEVPQYWEEAAQWLNDNAENQNTLLLPGAEFGDYLWGSTRDDILQAIVDTPWSVRSVIPLAPPGHIRMLDTLEREFASGRGSSRLTSSLRRSQIRYLLVRMDLDVPGATDPSRVRSTLDSTPGVRRVAAFGPVIGRPTTLQSTEGERLFFDSGLSSRGRVVQIYEVSGVDSAEPRTTGLDGVPVVVGDSSGLLAVADEISPGTPALLASDLPRDWTPGSWYLTDSLRRQEVAFGRISQNRSATLTPDEPFRSARPVHDYLAPGMERWLTTRQIEGVARITASSAGSDVTGWQSAPGKHPAAAFDGDPLTHWSPSPTAEDDTHWIEVEFLDPVDASAVELRLTPFQRERRVRVVTDRGASEGRVAAGERVMLDAPTGLTTTLRLEFPGAPQGLSVDDIWVADVDVTRPLRLPETPLSWGRPEQIRLAVGPEAVECHEVVSVRRCRGGGEVLSEDGSVLDRIVPLSAGFDARATVAAQPRNTDALGEAMTRDSDGFTLRASSTATFGPTHGALAMVDGRRETGWIGGIESDRTWLEVEWDDPQPLSSLVLRTDASLAASVPSEAVLTFDDGSATSVAMDDDGIVEFDTVETSSVRIEITDLRIRSTISENGLVTALPVGVSELDFPDATSPLADSAEDEIVLACGSGPTVVVNGTFHETTATTTRRDVIDERTIAARLCDDDVVTLRGGENRLTVGASDLFRPIELLVEPTEAHDSTAATVAPDRVLSAFGHNVNVGWTASDAQAVTVEGWQQGWIASEATELTPRYAPGLFYQLALAMGAMFALGLVCAAWLLRRRPVAATADDRDPHSRIRRIVGYGSAVVAVLALTGGWGIPIAVVAVAAAVMLPRRDLRVALALSLALPAALAGAMMPYGSELGWAGDIEWTQWCLVASVAVVLVVAFDVAPTSRRRLDGASINR